MLFYVKLIHVVTIFRIRTIQQRRDKVVIKKTHFLILSIVLFVISVAWFLLSLEWRAVVVFFVGVLFLIFYFLKNDQETQSTDKSKI